VQSQGIWAEDGQGCRVKGFKLRMVKGFGSKVLGLGITEQAPPP
jgi:hypothetical protein